LIGPDAQVEAVIALAVPPWEAGKVQIIEPEEIEEVTRGQSGRRPPPDLWQMAVRFARVIERLENNLNRMSTDLRRRWRLCRMKPHSKKRQ
jgi:hypothetical protein